VFIGGNDKIIPLVIAVKLLSTVKERNLETSQ